MTNKRPRYSVIDDVHFGEDCKIYDHTNLYGCEIGDKTKIDSFVYIEENVSVGDRCTIRPFVFIPTGVTICDDVFIGPGTMFTNDRYPSTSGDWELEETIIKDGAAIGAGTVVTPGVTIGPQALVGAGSVVTNDIAAGATVAGNPANSLE